MSNCNKHESKFELECGPGSKNKVEQQVLTEFKIIYPEILMVFLSVNKITIGNTALFVLSYLGVDVSSRTCYINEIMTCH